MTAVEQRARAHVVTDFAGERSAVPVALSYDPESDPGAVHMTLPPGLGATPDDWVFTRELLERGLRGPVANGPVSIWPCGRAQAIVELHSPGGVSLVQFDSRALTRFLGRTYEAVATVRVNRLR
ncbi:SsgA family sporulation/cell division regulator [Streptomyces sp. SID4919]|uniref:Cell division protein n=1 Tax=Streptomyces uncialis TaxID=1048205 RepID=A0A1Q4VDT6_9ACTN|nr:MULTISPECIES: SsgA family sporulation/cell division regulator [Streptomyces]MCX4660784.1 SsgA family sporulation/cell division regulator [Streptomyces uncialis]MYY11844.1 SsgA family sporulation/cell division regulator [Streptomyces sp. SID4919]OKH95959.1 cell division protein [Streptomyces uncialis]WST68774.1 SsgA family sporulation/cell division regulator [Streptomyces uncialis]WTE15704.1 SsgA family sporulation/cell division regulator [Streptomyces uncialis]